MQHLPVRQYVAYTWFTTLANRRRSDRTRLAGRHGIFYRHDGSRVMSYHEAWYVQVARWHQMTTVRVSTQEKMVLRALLKAGRVGMDERWPGSAIPNSWRDRRKRSRGCHGGFAQRNTRQGWRGTEWSCRCIAWNECCEVGGCWDCSTLWVMAAILKFILWRTVSASAIQTEQAWYDPRLLGPQRVQGYSDQAVGETGLKQMCRREENCNNQAVIQL